MAKKRKGNDWDKYFKQPCKAINQILLIKKLSPEEAAALYSKLKVVVVSLGKDISISDYG